MIDSDIRQKYHEVISSVYYKENVFTLLFSKDKTLIGAFIDQNAAAQKFVNYGSIYNTILDLDEKIKYSFLSAIELADELDYDKWKPFDLPSDNEKHAIYYTENAVFRISVLWDLLAHLYNIKNNFGLSAEQVSFSRIIKKLRNGDPNNLLAKKIIDYIDEKDGCDDNEWTGDYAFLNEYRNKLTHRISPNISTIAQLSNEIRLPMSYIMFRAIGDYYNVSLFIQELLEEILKDYDHLIQASELEKMQKNCKNL